MVSFLQEDYSLYNENQMKRSVILVRVSDLGFKAKLTFCAQLSQATSLKESNNNEVLSPSIHHSEMGVMHYGSVLT